MITIRSIVSKRDRRTRNGRGFSRGELKKAGLSPREALKLGIPIDSRRKTAHKENINAIRRFMKSKARTFKSKTTKAPKS